MPNEVFYVCVSKGEFVSIDQSSGGYPYRSAFKGVAHCHHWTDQAEAQKYANIWTRGNDSYGYEDMKVMKVVCSIEEV